MPYARWCEAAGWRAEVNIELAKCVVWRGSALTGRSAGQSRGTLPFYVTSIKKCPDEIQRRVPQLFLDQGLTGHPNGFFCRNQPIMLPLCILIRMGSIELGRPGALERRSVWVFSEAIASADLRHTIVMTTPVRTYTNQPKDRPIVEGLLAGSLLFSHAAPSLACISVSVEAD
jgi:hypothetical protein